MIFPFGKRHLENPELTEIMRASNPIDIILQMNQFKSIIAPNKRVAQCPEYYSQKCRQCSDMQLGRISVDIFQLTILSA